MGLTKMRNDKPRIRLISEERIYKYEKENNYLGFITYMEIKGWKLIKHKGRELMFEKYNKKGIKPHYPIIKVFENKKYE